MAVLAAGCGGSRASWKVPNNASAIERDAVTWYEGWQARLDGGDVDGWSAAFTDNAVYIGLRANEEATGAAAIAKVAHASKAGSATTIEAGVADDGNSVWLTAAFLAERHTVLLERASAWRPIVAHHSIPSAGVDAPAPVELSDAVTEDARPLAELISRALGTVDAFTAVISKRPGTVAFGPGPEDRASGTHEVTEWIRAFYARPGARMVRSGGLRAGLTASGRLGWVATNLDLVTADGKNEVSHPGRLTAIFAHEGDGWAIVALHISHGLKE